MSIVAKQLTKASTLSSPNCNKGQTPGASGQNEIALDYACSQKKYNNDSFIPIVGSTEPRDKSAPRRKLLAHSNITIHSYTSILTLPLSHPTTIVPSFTSTTKALTTLQTHQSHFNLAT